MEEIVGSASAILFTLVLLSFVSAMRKAKRLKEAYHFEPPEVSGDARYSTDEDCRKGKLLTGKGLRLAFSQSGRVLRYCGDSHLVTVGPTGSGKARDSLIGAIIDLGPKVLIANDPTGQLLNVCEKARRKVGPVYALAPFGVHKDCDKRVRIVRYNPMATLRADDPKLAIRCAKISDGLIPSGDEKSRFWNEGAKDLLVGLEMSVICLGEPEDRNLPTVCRILCGDLFGYCREVVGKTDNRYIKERLGSYAQAGAEDSRTVQDIVATARIHTQFIRNEVFGPSLSASDFSFKELRKKPCSLFIVLPVDAAADMCDRYYRLIIASALGEMLSEDCLGKTPVLFVLDEAAQLGRMQALEQAAAVARKYGIQLWTVFTDIPQMQKIYQEAYRSFLANSACQIFYPPSDSVTSDEISKLSGQTEMITQSKSVSLDLQTGEPHVSEGKNQQARPLLLPHEVRELGGDELLIFTRAKGVIRAKRRPYWKTHPGKCGPDPYEKGKRH